MNNSLYQLALLSLLIMLSACGGGDDKKKAPSICKENLFFFIVCVLGSSESAPDKGQDSGTYSIDIGKDAAASGEHGEIDEFEPNNLLDNANIVIFPGGSASFPFSIEPISPSIRSWYAPFCVYPIISCSMLN